MAQHSLGGAWATKPFMYNGGNYDDQLYTFPQLSNGYFKIEIPYRNCRLFTQSSGYTACIDRKYHTYEDQMWYLHSLNGGNSA